MKEDFSIMSREELHKISLEKNKRGNATTRALKAQQILYDLGGSFQRNSHRTQTANDDYNYGDPDKFTKRFK